MARKVTDANSAALPPPAATLEGREDQLIALAMDLVEKRMADGTASAAETVHFLKAGSRINQLQMSKLEQEKSVLQARILEMENRISQEDLLEEAVRAFRGYSGQEPVEVEDSDGYTPDLYGP